VRGSHRRHSGPTGSRARHIAIDDRLLAQRGRHGQADSDPGVSRSRWFLDPAPLTKLGGQWYTVLTHPWGTKSLSLRATAADGAGNSVTETIVDAFVLR
jgi:hypothetical protein